MNDYQILYNALIKAKDNPLQPASNNTIGGVKIGEGINVDENGTISSNSGTIPSPIYLEYGTNKDFWWDEEEETYMCSTEASVRCYNQVSQGGTVLLKRNGTHKILLVVGVIDNYGGFLFAEDEEHPIQRASAV